MFTTRTDLSVPFNATSMQLGILDSTIVISFGIRAVSGPSGRKRVSQSIKDRAIILSIVTNI